MAGVCLILGVLLVLSWPDLSSTLPPEDGTPPSPVASDSPPPPAIAPFDTQMAKEHQAVWARHLGVPVEYENSIGMRFVLIPPGEFDMGSTEAEVARLLDEAKAKNLSSWYIERLSSEAPRHRVRITKPFWLSRHEVTRGQFRRFVDDTGYQTEGERDGKGSPGLVNGRWVQELIWNRELGVEKADDHPVVHLAWHDASAFAQWLSRKEGTKCHLPTDTQWEYACRAGTTTSWYSDDNEAGLKEQAWFKDNSKGGTHPVGLLRANAWGLYDMHGNVSEWCQDCGGNAENWEGFSPLEDPAGPSASAFRVYRGGSWSSDSSGCRAAYHDWDAPSRRNDDLGFRIARTVLVAAGWAASPHQGGEGYPLGPLPATDRPTPKLPDPAARLPIAAATTSQQFGPAPPLAVAPFDAKKAQEHQAAWAEYLGVPVKYTNSIGMDFRLIPAGEFLMGTPSEVLTEIITRAQSQMSHWTRFLPSETPQHSVRLPDPIYAATREVTFRQFAGFVSETGYVTETERAGGVAVFTREKRPQHIWRNRAFAPTDDSPVVLISWNDAQAFCRWLSGKPGENVHRLPTEAEWEFFCRAGDSGLGPIRPDAENPFGLERLLEWVTPCVGEWCEDRPRTYTPRQEIAPFGTAGYCRVLRGFRLASEPRFSERFVRAPLASSELGFRLVSLVKSSKRALHGEESKKSEPNANQERPSS